MVPRILLAASATSLLTLDVAASATTQAFPAVAVPALAALFPALANLILIELARSFLFELSMHTH
jgi:hypothetical protein